MSNLPVILKGEIKAAVAKRIETLGQMNDRHTQYLTAGNVNSLLELADEYEQKGMIAMAAEIRKEADEI